MYPHSISIFNVIKNKDDTITYHKTDVSNVFFYIERIISQEGNGEKYTSAYHVHFSKESLKKYIPKNEFKAKKDTFTLRENDIVTLGTYNDIEDLSDLQKNNIDFFLIKTVSENLYGDNELQNIEVTN